MHSMVEQRAGWISLIAPWPDVVFWNQPAQAWVKPRICISSARTDIHRSSLPRTSLQEKRALKNHPEGRDRVGLERIVKRWEGILRERQCHKKAKEKRLSRQTEI